MVDADLSQATSTAFPTVSSCRVWHGGSATSHLLTLIKQWLVVPVEEDDGRGGRSAEPTQAKASQTGYPARSSDFTAAEQCVHAPVYIGLENVGTGEQRSSSLRMVNYADDLVILCRRDGQDRHGGDACEMMSEGLKLSW